MRFSACYSVQTAKHSHGCIFVKTAEHVTTAVILVSPHKTANRLPSALWNYIGDGLGLRVLHVLRPLTLIVPRTSFL